MEDIIIETPRLLLKGISPALIRALFETQTPGQIKTFLGTTDEGFVRFKDMYEKGMETNRISLYFFLLISKENHAPIGECGFHSWNKAHRRAEVFYLIKDEANKQKGYISEALGQVLHYGFDKMNLNRIEAFVWSENIPSVKLLNNFGFTKEGMARSHYFINDAFYDSDMYSLLASEYKR